MIRFWFWLLTLYARWRASLPSAVEFEFGFPKAFSIQVIRSEVYRGAFSWWITDEKYTPQPGDTLNVHTENYGRVPLLVVSVKDTGSHGTFGFAVPTVWRDHEAMAMAFNDYQSQTSRELRALQQCIYALVAIHGPTAIDWSYFQSKKPVEVELIPAKEKVHVRVVVLEEEGEKVTYG